MSDHLSRAAELTAKGYRRVSNKYRRLARIDRHDWLNVLGRYIRRPVADFFDCETGKLSASWADHYRRCFSKDVLVDVPEDVFKAVPGSGHDSCGYIEPIEKE